MNKQTLILNYSGKILKTIRPIKKIIKPEVFDLQDKVGGGVDDLSAIDDGLDKSFNE